MSMSEVAEKPEKHARLCDQEMLQREGEMSSMVEIGYKLASEEHGPLDLIRYARLAEDAGFSFAMISDHYHPWISREGQSPFVWSTIGGISQITADLKLATGVTCPTMRYHPAIIAQAAATAAAMMPDRFMLGLGTGENLNEHILGDRWPPAPVRTEMLEEAVDIIRTLWQGGMKTYYGYFYTVENARIFTLPERLPPIFIAAEGPISASAAGRIGDGFINAGTEAEKSLTAFRETGGEGKPAYLELSVCWGETEETARRTAYERWPVSANTGEMNRILPTPVHYEQIAKMATEDDIAAHVPCGPEPEPVIKKIETGIRMGFDHICIHQIGLQQQEFMEFARDAILPHFG
jgi:coenzyme F420-dependent glucose-6-phosphate dehydrogenase